MASPLEKCRKARDAAEERADLAEAALAESERKRAEAEDAAALAATQRDAIQAKYDALVQAIADALKNPPPPPPPPPPPEPPPYEKGISVGGPFTYDWTPEAQAIDLDLLQSAGAQWIRLNLAVGNTGKGRDLAKRCRDRGLKVVGSVVWGKGRTITPEQAAATAIAEAPFLDAIEVGNECNRWSQWPDTPENYAKIYNAAKGGAKSASPEIPVLTCGLSPGPNVPGDLDPREFLHRALGAGMLPDAIAWNPYSAPNLPSEDATWNTFTKMRTDPTFSQYPIWITEFGAATYTGSGGVTPARQAEMIEDVFAEAERLGIERVLIYQGRDGGTDPNNDQHHFGIIGKPAYAAFAAA